MRAGALLCPVPEAAIEGKTFRVTLLVESLRARGAAAPGDRLRFPDCEAVGLRCKMTCFIEGDLLPNNTTGAAS